MAAKLDQTAESICGPKWAIARDLSVYDGANAATSKGKTVSADRGPPMVRIYSRIYQDLIYLVYRFGQPPSVVT